MIVVLTQTYGNDRKELYDIRSKDSLLQYFISQFDHDIYSFHNCSKETIEYYKSKNINREYVEFGDIPYTHTIYHLIDKLKKIGCTKLIFLQDDAFTWNQSKEDIDDLVNKIKSDNFPLLNMEMSFDEFKDEVRTDIKITDECNNIKFYKAFTFDFSKNGGYSFDDAPFVLDFDYINVIFDNQFFQIGDVWRGELYNNDKFKLINFPRHLTNKKFFKRYNILGRNSWNRNQEIIDLNKNFLQR
jgi:hypothetical protein